MSGMTKVVVLTAIMAMSSWVGADTRVDLQSAWRLALENDLVLKAGNARREAAVEVRAQTRAALLPQVGLHVYREDASSDGERIGLTGTGIGLVNLRTDSDTDFAALQLRQSLLAVDKWIAYRQSADLRDVAELEYAFARETLALRVTQAYFTVLATLDARTVAASHLDAVRRFREQVGYRYEAGVVANTDLQEAQAALDAAVADEIDARHAVNVASQQFANLVGVEPGALRAVSGAIPASLPEPADLGWWLGRAREASTPVRMAQLGSDVARSEVHRRRAASYPTLDLVAARANTDRSSTNPFETLDVSGTTVRIELNLPLFAGGAIQSSVRQAAAQQRAREFELDDVRRSTELQAREAWLGIESALQRIRARDQAQKSAATALAAAEIGLVEGLRTTLDVLEAQRLVAQARAAASRARYDYILAVLALRAATGLLDDSAIAGVNAWLE